MTIEQVLNCSADELEAYMSQPVEILEKHWEKYLKVTRPEWAPKQTNKTSSFKPTPQVPMTDAKRRGLQMLKEQGIELDFNNKKGKRR